MKYPMWKPSYTDSLPYKVFYSKPSVTDSLPYKVF